MKTHEEDGHKPKKEAAEGTNLAGTLLLKLDLQNYEKNKFLFFKPPSPWYFVRATLEDKYTTVSSPQRNLMWLTS